ncbi:PRC-barrel domain-containing protein [Stappia sp. F7233]|uniref:PRC-barrel domain-containing protein n=1 Tax=Stappia albiluteola TaxID=2758565 RepID=A0A839AK63_9HYPH|nr:PRC-barrel domain-containing protein [Stappia albiluteola]MBA5779456.1 PRC-barrel domain-containing protein [Stappia albiluteola]
MMRQMFLTSVVSLAFAVAPAFAEETTPMQQGTGPAEAATASPQAATAAQMQDLGFLTQQENGQWLANSYIGQPVTNSEQEVLGDVADLLIGPNGEVTGALVSIGGFLGIGEKIVALPFDALVRIEDGSGTPRLLLAASSDQLENAPEFMTLAAVREAEELERMQREAERQQTEPATVPAPAPNEGTPTQ